MAQKQRIPMAVRQAVARAYGCEPAGRSDANCHYCGAAGSVWWDRTVDGKPKSWVVFDGFELDHFVPEHLGGQTSAENLVLACRTCNRSKGHKTLAEWKGSF